jgi:hypothetical protein
MYLFDATYNRGGSQGIGSTHFQWALVTSAEIPAAATIKDSKEAPPSGVASGKKWGLIRPCPSLIGLGEGQTSVYQRKTYHRRRNQR